MKIKKNITKKKHANSVLRIRDVCTLQDIGSRIPDYSNFYPKIVTKLSTIWVWDPRFWIRKKTDSGSGKKPIPDPRSRTQWSKRHRKPDLDPQHCLPWGKNKNICKKVFDLTFHKTKYPETVQKVPGNILCGLVYEEGGEEEKNTAREANPHRSQRCWKIKKIFSTGF